MGETRFRDNNELKYVLKGVSYKSATEAWFWDHTEDFCFISIDCLKEKWAKCIEVKGDYIEK